VKDEQLSTVTCCDCSDVGESGPPDNCKFGGCFPHDAQVELQGGKKVDMSTLNVGDVVRVGASEFSEVYMFSHKDAEVKVSTPL
jgi:hypothetical protein